MENPKSQPQVFISYAREDAAMAERLYTYLSEAGYKPWMDTKDILPGELWVNSIQVAIQNSDFFLACLSTNSVDKRGMLQKEIKSALDTWEGMLEGDIYLIPVRLDDCAVPERLSNFQWVDLFEENGWTLLSRALGQGVERRTKQASRLLDETKRKGKRNDRSGSSTPPRLFPIPSRLLGILAGILLILVSPWFYNNYLFRATRPSLPEVCPASVEKIRVGVANLPGCGSEAQSRFMAGLGGEGNISTVSILPATFTSSAESRAGAGEYDLVIWGNCPAGGDDSISLNFELISSRSPVEVYEPPVFHVNGDILSMVEAVRAIVRYQHGDYLSASSVFETLAGEVESAELPLFHANSLMFGGKYVESEAAFTAYLQADPNFASAAYNNLGVALNNRDVSIYKEPSLQGLAEFNRAIEISAAGNPSDIRNIDVGSIALFNRSRIHLLDGQYEDALTDCEAIRSTNSNSALSYVCLADYSMTRYRFTTFNLPGRLPLKAIDQNLQDAEKRTPHPPITHFLRAIWHLDHAWEQKQNAVDEFAAYISEMQNQACLSTDQMFAGDAQALIEQYSR